MKLFYFDLQAKAESIRILLNHAKVDYEDVRITGDTWKTLKPNTKKVPYGQLPVFQIDGMFLAQQNAILRYLGSKYGYYPESLEERYKCDAIIDLIGDFSTPIIKNNFGPGTPEEK